MPSSPVITIWRLHKNGRFRETFREDLPAKHVESSARTNVLSSLELIIDWLISIACNQYLHNIGSAINIAQLSKTESITRIASTVNDYRWLCRVECIAWNAVRALY